MRWTPGGVSGDIEDQRSGGPSFGGFGPHLGIGGFIVVGLLSLVFHRNLFTLFYGPSDRPSQTVSSEPPPANDKQVQFVSFVLDDVQHLGNFTAGAGTAPVPARQAGAVSR